MGLELTLGLIFSFFLPLALYSILLSFYFPFLMFYFPLHCCSPRRLATVLFASLFSSLPCYSPRRLATLLFASLFSSLPCYSPLHAIWLSSSHYYSPLWLLFYFKYKFLHTIAFLFTPLCFPIRVIAIDMLLFAKKSCTTPLHSFLQELGVVGS